MALKALGAFPTLDGVCLREINGRHVAKKCYSRVLRSRAALRPTPPEILNGSPPSDFYAEAAATAGKHQSLSHLHSRQILYKLEDGGRSPAFDSLMLSG